jgi:aminopeptidase
MGVTSKAKVLIITDKKGEQVGNALKRAALEVGVAQSNTKIFILENLTSRPLTKFPKEIVEKEIPWATVTFWTATSMPGELEIRTRFIKRAIQYARHAHMPNITPKLMEQGMSADYDEVHRLTHKIYEIVKEATKIEIRNDLGVDIVAEFDHKSSSWRWVPSDGRYHEKGKWGNLPEGETLTAPKKLSGHFVTNLLGDWFSEKYGNFEDPLSFDVEDSRIKFESITCKNRFLRKEIEDYLRTDENSNRASEFALPTNPLLISLPTIGNLLQDEKARPHIAFGDPYRNKTGAPWSSKTHVDMLLERCDVLVDDGKKKEIMKAGKYVI